MLCVLILGPKEARRAVVDVMIFGAGETCRALLARISQSGDDVRVIALTDNDSSKWGRTFYGYTVIPPQEMSLGSFDYVIVASIFYADIALQLMDLGVPGKKIVDGNLLVDPGYYTLPLPKDVTQEPLAGMITGLSYAVGIKTEVFPERFVNLAMRSQDLFFDYCLARYLLDCLGCRSIRYAIVGLSYYSFQCDMTQSSLAYLALRYGDVLTELAPLIRDDLMSRRMEHVREIKKRYDRCPAPYVPLKLQRVAAAKEEERRNVSKEAFEKAAAANGKKDYPQTARENHHILRQYMKMLTAYRVKPVIVVHPQHRLYRSAFPARLKEEFYEVVDGIRDEYDFQLIDGYELPYGDGEYADGHHLNGAGALRFSKYLRETIVWDR